MLYNGRCSTYQKLLVFATALTIVLDGVDNQLLPNAVPTLIQEWGRPRREFTDALAIGPFGMMLGGLFGRIVGDRWGRRPALRISDDIHKPNRAIGVPKLSMSRQRWRSRGLDDPDHPVRNVAFFERGDLFRRQCH